MPQYLHTAQGAILAGLGFILVAPGCAFALPRRLGKIALKKTPEDRHSLLKRTPEDRQSLEDIATPLTAQDAGSAPSRAG